ncbi:thiamine phosphate synthase [uncultured Dysosmobacter sp.]|uniref:thiamine phosphate synthase n=1 Tax=uncultured Dysosmobacter sp. TaxID=2591384 RepID=UPI00260B2605|nr:thiamine phosphate synthase [uncultured Dysosmobacter sp.]
MRFTRDEIRSAMLLYAVTDRMWLKEGETLPQVVGSVLENGATFLQIREKDLAPAAFEAEAEQLKALCACHHVPFVVNDSVEIALACGADGVHVGQSDIHGRDIRAIIGPDKILGISAGTVAEAVAAEKAGADYIGVGAVFGTSTKKDARSMTVERLREIAASVTIPVVAIGGIGAGNILQLKGSGVDGAAVVSAIFGAADPGQATARLLALSREMVGRCG